MKKGSENGWKKKWIWIWTDEDEYEEKTYEMRGKIEKRGDRATTVKLPKLMITKFKGTPLDWFRFWNQFESKIDKVVSLLPLHK